MKTGGKYRFWLCVRAYSRVSLPPFGKFLARVPAVNRETAELRFEGKGKVFPFNGGIVAHRRRGYAVLKRNRTSSFRNSSDTLTRKISYNFSIKIFSRRYLFRTRCSFASSPIQSPNRIVSRDYQLRYIACDLSLSLGVINQRIPWIEEGRGYCTRSLPRRGRSMCP